ncbi:MAG: hypothetical protein U9R02_00985 [Thermodesulfobacteriota bacterium]|nr:hypothetical protein [Thermodesulfobacteriota bacterium]
MHQDLGTYLRNKSLNLGNKEFGAALEKRTRKFAVRIIYLLKTEYEECSELLAIFTSIAAKR